MQFFWAIKHKHERDQEISLCDSIVCMQISKRKDICLSAYFKRLCVGTGVDVDACVVDVPSGAANTLKQVMSRGLGNLL